MYCQTARFIALEHSHRPPTANVLFLKEVNCRSILVLEHRQSTGFGRFGAFNHACEIELNAPQEVISRDDIGVPTLQCHCRLDSMLGGLQSERVFFPFVDYFLLSWKVFKVVYKSPIEFAFLLKFNVELSHYE